MERSVKILRCKRTGDFILHPMGTFHGYGGYVGLIPYRVVSRSTSGERLGQLIADLLRLSGPTGVHIKEYEAYVEQAMDDHTRKIKNDYRLDEKMSTSVYARRFSHGEIVQRAGQKSWVLQPYTYASKSRTLSGKEHKPSRIKHSEGIAGLGVAVLECMQIGEQK
jgi:hypothetical protein